MTKIMISSLAVKHRKHVNRFAAHYYCVLSMSSNSCHMSIEPMTSVIVVLYTS